MTDIDEQGRPEPPLAADETAILLGFAAPMGHGGLEGRARLAWHSAAEDSPEQLHALWQDAVARSGSLVAEALADGGALTGISYQHVSQLTREAS